MTEEQKTIKVTEQDLHLPLVKILTGRGFITGKSDSGKSNTAGKLCEEILDEGYPLLVIDTEGEYHGLKEEYELLHVGAGEECDLKVGPEHAQKIAELGLEKNVPIVLDTSGYVERDVVNELVYKTCKKIFDLENTLRKPYLVLVEEAHEWIPEQGTRGEDGEVTEILIRIAKRGRKRGLGIGAMSQRPAAVDKDYITQTDYRAWHKLDWGNDLDIVKDVLEKNKPRVECIEEEECSNCGEVYELSQFDNLQDAKCPECGTDPRNWREVISNLEPGEAVLEADFLDFKARQVKFLRKETVDLGATPGLDDFEVPELKSVSSDLVDELQEISEQKQREQDRIAQLEQQLEEKEDEIKELQDELDRAQDMSDMAQQFTEAMASGGSPEVQEKVDEIREEKNERIRELESDKEELENELSEVRESRQQLQQRVEDLEEYEQAVQHMDELREGVKRMSEALGLDVDGSDEQLKKKLQNKNERVDELEAKISKLEQQGYSLDEEFEDKMDFLKHDAVRDEVTKAADKVTYDEDNAWDALSVLVDQEEATLDDLSPYVSISRSSLSSVMARLAEHGVVKKGKSGQKNLYSLNTDGMRDIIQTRKKRSEMNELKNQVKS